MSLETGRNINGRVVARLPITDAVIARVEELGMDQGQPFRPSKTLVYEWRPNKPVEEQDESVGESTTFEDTITPEPIEATLEDPSPNPFVTLDTMQNKGAQEKIMVQQTDLGQTDLGTTQREHNTGSSENANIGANRNEGANKGAKNHAQRSSDITGTMEDHLFDGEEEEIVFTNESEEESNLFEDNREIEIRRREEKDRRASHWDEKVDENHGRGKRERKAPQRS